MNIQVVGISFFVVVLKKMTTAFALKCQNLNFSPFRFVVLTGKYFCGAHFLFPSNNSNVGMGMEEKRQLQKRRGCPKRKRVFFKNIMNANMHLGACIK